MGLDRGLTYPKGIPTPDTVSAIRQARKNGAKAFISTGPAFDSIPAAIEAIGFYGGIFSSGGVVMLEKTVLAQHFMNSQTARAVISLLIQQSVLYTLETADGRFNRDHASHVLSQANMNSVSEEMQRFTAQILFDPSTHPLSEYEGQPIFKIAYYSADW